MTHSISTTTKGIEGVPPATVERAGRPRSRAAPTPQAAHPAPATLDSLGAELEAADWDVRTLARHLPELARLAATLSPTERLGWMIGLHRAWDRQGWALPNSARLALLELASLWCDWPLARVVGESLLERDALDVHGALSLAVALHRLGESEAAMAGLVHGLIAHPKNQRFAAAYRSFASDMAYRAGLPNVDGSQWGDADLRLVPLGHRHLDDFAWQYHDPAIAARCCLPRFSDAWHWHDWLDEIRGHGDQVVFAVLHREWGFIGSVSLVMQGDLGFFYYWLGRDFQGNGLGPRAGALLLAYAERHWGLRACYAKVYADNAASRRGLAKLGFQQVDLSIAGDGAEEDMFRRAACGLPVAAVAAEARDLFARMRCRIRVLYPLLAPSSEGSRYASLANFPVLK